MKLLALKANKTSIAITSPSQFTVSLTVLAYLVAAGPHLMAMPRWLALCILVISAWRVVTAWQRWRPPHWLIRTLVTFSALGAVLASYGTLWGRRAATALLCVMVAVKLMEMFRTRDARQIAALGFFLVAAQFLFSQQIALLPYLLIACGLATAAMLSVQADDDRRRHPDVVARQNEPLKSGGSDWSRHLKSGLVLLGLSIPFALVLFAVFPRLASPLWGIPENALDGRTGLSDEMSPGAIASLYADDSPAFRVEFEGQRPEQSDLYWRGPVLWHFNGTTWSRLISAHTETPRRPTGNNPPLQYSVQLEPNERRWLFTLDYPVEWSEEARLTRDYQLVRERPVTRLISYSVSSEPDFIDEPQLDPTLRRAALRLPEGQNPRTLELAADYRQEYADDRELINAVLRWFNEDAFFYSLETLPLGLNGADEFLFDLKTGYCEYYASAFAILMRAAGIPARIVTGYQGGFWQQSSEYLLVRQSDAHAWVEVWLQGRGWTRIDPTAAVSPTRILENARRALNDTPGWMGGRWAQNLRNQFDRVQHYWNQWVLGFNAARQNELFSRLGLDRLSGPLLAVVIVLLALLTVVPLAFLLRGLGQTRRVLTPDQRAWKRMIQKLKPFKLQPRRAETPLEFAERAAVKLNNGQRLINAARVYNQLRYAHSDNISESLRASLQQASRNWRPDPNPELLNSAPVIRVLLQRMTTRKPA